MQHRLRTLTASLCATLVAGTVLVGPSASAAPTADSRASGWLTRQLTGGVVHNDQYDFDDYGLTVDVAFALEALDRAPKKVRAAREAVAANIEAYTTGGEWAPDDVYAGSVAKAVVLAQRTGGDPRDFGGVDLVERLEQRVQARGPLAGRISDKSESDYANVIGQSFAAEALARAKSPLADEAIDFLLLQQCGKGFFRLNFNELTTADQGCDDAPRSARTPDNDVTAIAVLGLDALPKSHRSKAVRSAIADGKRWLVRQQRKNGSFDGGPGDDPTLVIPNANSTGLASWALGELGVCAPARKAARWVARLQVPGGVARTPLAGETGAIAFDRVGYDTAKTDGITVEARDQWRRASAQAAPALRWLARGACRR
ncbi:terpene cyclase/mutase family protein [Nocardioides ferulae]|uniref:terpene cyclase/mutase family protein n=1 Tax=Nocardioides ferulae TaxID=2340821 RepID=UPI000EB2191D|nr:terpene cyclase/mutase family protein [Nocardioides ferulae]